MFGIYMSYLSQITNYSSNNILNINGIFSNYFSKLKCIIHNKSYDLLEVISLTGKSINDYIKIIKKKNLC